MNAAQLHKLSRRLRELALEVSGEEDEERVSVSELAIIEDVANHPNTSIGDIAKRTGLAQSLVSRTVATMRDANVFTTDADPADGRKLQVTIESKTRSRLFRERGTRSIEEKLAQVLPNITPSDLKKAVAMLEKLAELFESQQKSE